MIATRKISLQSRGPSDIIDITQKVAEQVAGAGVNNGVATLFVTGSTAGLTTMEYEPGLLADFKAMWQRLTPQGLAYDHDRRWGDGNGYSHVRASLLGASLVVPFHDRKLALGTWQQLVLIDFDNRPRSRELIVQIIGE